ncbi:MAG: carboxypeptidase-like regulatory domain-containing protein, partial [Rikenellaceae bacterium]
TSTGTTSGSDGSFTLAAPANGTIIVSYIGYQSQTVSIGGGRRASQSLLWRMQLASTR